MAAALAALVFERRTAMTHSVVVVAALLVAAAGCGASEGAQARAPNESPVSFDYLFPGPGERSAAACPAALRGVRVASIPTDNGSMLVFTSNDGLSEVRRRARALAVELDSERADGSGAPPKSRFGGIRTTTRYEEIPEGASVEIIALQASQSLSLRDQLDEIARQMQRERNCPEELLAFGPTGGQRF
jgi:hypothetical protein